jgi:hypothetical protein
MSLVSAVIALVHPALRSQHRIGKIERDSVLIRRCEFQISLLTLLLSGSGHLMFTRRSPFNYIRVGSLTKYTPSARSLQSVRRGKPNNYFAKKLFGDRSDPNNPYASWFVFHSCHGHYHIRDFSIHELLTPDGQRVAAGTKQGFCMEDSFKYDGGKSNGYHCGNQEITSGWGDWYYKKLVGQWIDITGAPEGDYIVRITINKGDSSGRIFDEGQNKYPNVAETRIHIPDPCNKVAIDSSPLMMDK